MMWRHGDVMIAAVAAIPHEAHPRPGAVLARGEVTGHAHRIERPDTADLWELNGELYLRITADSARVVHEEHRPVTLTQGVYRVWMQREYTPQAIRPVRD
jgi:hypothetical protein